MQQSPAVSFLINLYSLSASQVSLIPRSGPKNRLLKGDILNYLKPFSPTKHFYYSQTLQSIPLELYSSLALKLDKKVDYINFQNRKEIFRNGSKYFTVTTSPLEQDLYLKPNQLGILNISVESQKVKKVGDIIDELSWKKITTGYRLDLTVNSSLISKSEAMNLLKV